jgi:NADH-quinone oxidoreductase subunit M
MGIILVGITAMGAGTTGAVLGMFAHALIVSFLFLAVGIIHTTFGERDIRLLKGLAAEAPGIAYAFVVGILAMVGLPLLPSFAGDMMIFIGAYGAFGLLGLLPLAALVAMAAFLYFVVQKVFFETATRSQAIDSVSSLQLAGAAMLIVAMFIFGIVPHLIASIL